MSCLVSPVHAHASLPRECDVLTSLNHVVRPTMRAFPLCWSGRARDGPTSDPSNRSVGRLCKPEAVCR